MPEKRIFKIGNDEGLKSLALKKMTDKWPTSCWPPLTQGCFGASPPPKQKRSSSQSFFSPQPSQQCTDSIIFSKATWKGAVCSYL